MSEETKNHDEEEDRVHTWEVNKKKKKRESELSWKGAKQRGQDQSGLKYNASWCHVRVNEDRHLTQWWSDSHEVELR